MFNFILTKKSYLLIVTILFIIGCGGGNSQDISNISRDTSNKFSSILKDSSEVKAFATINSISNVNEFNNSATNIQHEQQKLLDAINARRATRVKCGDEGWFGPTHPLTWNRALYTSALEHSLDMAFSNHFSHDGSGTEYDITGDGRPSKFNERIIRQYGGNYYSIGENLAGGQTSIQQVMDDFMASPGHCANIMSSNYTEVGVAIVEYDQSNYRIYWTQNFGSKRL